ncbi:TolC family protein [Fluviicola taffensis]|uniref:Outer membrane efflux protein n=1 Tax=Fluviicola taffensis (strain DSM 16823 / NCIMB 13979 / RW262) TaxID=755732 RepID=F2IFJ8_FLUTR|nr:TolC family protein [Fluviicola taffensis]AEA45712.1 outer membrane efflux protein [Fluviicola taffensis DSM 16823]
MKETTQNYRLSLLMLLSLLAGSMSFVRAQSGQMSLQQCIQYGLSKNSGILKSQLEIDRTNEKKNETRADYLPQVSGNIQLMDNLKLQTSILPGEMIGQPGTQVAVQFGTKYNTSLGLDAKQVIYDQSLIYSMKLTKQSSKVSEINARKTEEQLIYDIASAYYAAQVSFTQKKLIESNLAQVDTLLKITKIQFDNDAAKQLDLDKLTVNFTNLQTDLATSNTNLQQQMMLLKYYMGMSLDQNIELPVIPLKEQAAVITNTESLNNTDLELIQAQREVYSVTLQQIKAGYLPSLSLNFHAGVQNMQNDLRIFEKGAQWFPTSYIGLNLNVPIFDGLAKNSRVKQTKIQMEQSELEEQYLTENLKMQRANANNALTANRAALESQQRNIELAKRVYETTQAQFVGGIATMTDIVNAETSLRDAQTNYLRALVQVKLGELDLIKSTGNIRSLN